MPTAVTDITQSWVSVADGDNGPYALIEARNQRVLVSINETAPPNDQDGHSLPENEVFTVENLDPGEFVFVRTEIVDLDRPAKVIVTSG